MHRRIAGSRASTKSIHEPARSLRRFASLLSTFSPLAGVTTKTSRSIKPRERDLRCLRLFVLVRFLTRPTNHPRHAVCASNDESKPVRPHFLFGRQQSNARRYLGKQSISRRFSFPSRTSEAKKALRVRDCWLRRFGEPV